VFGGGRMDVDQSAIDRAAWNDEGNWSVRVGGHPLVYAAKDDLRVLVPKRPLRLESSWWGQRETSLGWTLNFARPQSLAVLASAVGTLGLALRWRHLR
jgi:uncharacterized membrane protein